MGCDKRSCNDKDKYRFYSYYGFSYCEKCKKDVDKLLKKFNREIGGN